MKTETASLARTVSKILVAAMASLSMWALSDASASASTAPQAPGFSPVEHEAVAAQPGLSTAERRVASPYARYDCKYWQGPQDLFVNCKITAGVIQITIYCSDGKSYNSPYYGIGDYMIHGSCKPNRLAGWKFNDVA